MAKVKEDFTAYIRMGKDGDPEPVEFSEGEEVTVIQDWEGDLILVQNEYGKVFNIKKALLEI